MIAFVWCILVTTLIGVGFKLFPTYRINTFNAIVINYTVCLALGTFLDPHANMPFSKEVIQSPWFRYDLVMGSLFIVGFNITAIAIQRAGITLTTLIQRMSIILTVTFTVVFFREHFGWLEGLGLLFALGAIVAINLKPQSKDASNKQPFPYILIPVLAISAIIEIMLYYVEKSGLVGSHQVAFTTHGFGVAAIAGWIAIASNAFRRHFRFSHRDVIAGIMLGIPNFFSIYLLLHMLNSGWKGAIMYPMVNVAVLLLSSAVAVILFREKLNYLNWIGIALATLAILVIAYAHQLS